MKNSIFPFADLSGSLEPYVRRKVDAGREKEDSFLGCFHETSIMKETRGYGTKNPLRHPAKRPRAIRFFKGC